MFGAPKNTQGKKACSKKQSLSLTLPGKRSASNQLKCGQGETSLSRRKEKDQTDRRTFGLGESVRQGHGRTKKETKGAGVSGPQKERPRIKKKDGPLAEM